MQGKFSILATNKDKTKNIYLFWLKFDFGIRT